MTKLYPSIRTAVPLLLTMAATTLSAQGLGEPAIKMAFGKTQGNYKKVVADKLDLAFVTEAAYRFDKTAAIVFQLGYSQDPGDSILVNPSPVRVLNSAGSGVSWLPATGVNPSKFEHRVRKTTVEGFFGSILYRYEMPDNFMYIHGGIKVSMNRVLTNDTGTTWTTNGGLATGTTSANIIAVDAIADRLEKKTTNFAPVVGIGKRFSGGSMLELNAFTVKASNPTFTSTARNAQAYEKDFSGWRIEAVYGIQF